MNESANAARLYDQTTGPGGSGGNVVDAAFAIAFALAMVEPTQSAECGLHGLDNPELS